MSTRRVALVTGASGFTGRHLIACLLASGYEVAGFDRQNWPESDVALYRGDITDAGRLREVLGIVQPDRVFHLAALTNPRLEYAELHRVNALGTLTLLDAVRQVCPRAVVLITSTSAVYGRVLPEELPIGEDQPFRPANAYAVSKIAQEMIAYQQFAQHGLHVVRTRAFNLTGPGESAAFVTSAFARQIADIEAGQQEPVIRVGVLGTRRDFLDVRDAVRAYVLEAEQGEPGAVYNVCSGQSRTIAEVLEGLLALSMVRGITIREDPARLQPADVPFQVGNSSRLRERTGWQPEIPFERTLRDVLDYWRAQIGA